MENRIKRIIADHLDYNLEDVKFQSYLKHDLEADELDIIEIVVILESEFNIHIPNNTFGLNTDLTVEELVSIVRQLLKKDLVKEPKTKKTVKKRIIKFVETTYDDGTISMRPRTRGFSDFELVGILSYYHDLFKVGMMQRCNTKKND